MKKKKSKQIAPNLFTRNARQVRTQVDDGTISVTVNPLISNLDNLALHTF